MKIKRCISSLLAILIITGLFTPNTAFAATTRTQYVWVISNINVQVKIDANGWFFRASSGGSEVKGTRSGDFIVGNNYMQVKTNYTQLTKFAVDLWKNADFEYLDIVTLDEAKNSASGGNHSFAMSSGGQIPWIITEDKIPEGDDHASTKGVNAPGRLGSSGSGTYYSIKPAIQWEYANEIYGKGWKSITVQSAVKFESTTSLPDPGGGGGGGGGGDPDPEPEPDEPSEGRVTGWVKGSGTSVNYKDYVGSVSVDAEVIDESDYKDEGFLDYFDMTLEAFGKRVYEESSTQGGTIRKSLTGNISKSASWMIPEGRTSYRFEATLSASLALDNGTRSSDSATMVNYINLTNNLPTTTFSLKTNSLNGGEVKPNYYYTNTPAKINVTFNDSENDIYESYLSMGFKADMDNKLAQFIYYKSSSGEEQNNVSAAHMEVTDVVKSINGYTATIVFKQPGVYAYRNFVVDADSNANVRQVTNGSGTFIVRTDPAAPTAIITSPAYAFENEPFKVNQGSTDPNGVDDIIEYNWTNTADVTQEVDEEAAIDPAFKPITNVSNSWSGKNGGTLRFPVGSAHHYFKIKLGIKDATNLTSSTEQIIKVISNVPVASLTSDKDSNNLKENRKIVVSAADSLAPQTDPIQWADAVWTVEAVSGGTVDNIFEDTTQRNGNKQRTLQFNKPGVYKVTVQLKNNFSKNNSTHEDIGASTISMTINVVEDKAPLSSVSIISGKPNFMDNPMNHTVKFKVVSSSDDGDIITAPSSYNWVMYEDFNDDGNYTADEIIPQSRLTFNAEKTEVALNTNYEQGRHNKIKAVVTTTESYAEPFIQKFLSADGSHVRKTTVDITEVVNWIPKPVIIPPDSSNVNTPYEDADIDGDGIIDGKFIRSYTDDIFSVNTQITDEFPATCKVTWELAKKEHNGTFSTSTGGTPWISSSNVTQTLGHDGGSLKINSPGVYRLKMITKDDCGDTAEYTVMIRIYTLPQAVLESNPTYQIKSGSPWYTKENIRFDIRSNPTIVDDEWGKAWHTMNWDLDNWDVKPLSGQNVNEIHFMDPQYKDRYNSVFPNDTAKFSGRNSPLGFGAVVDKPIDIVVIPGLLGSPKLDNNLQLDDTERQQLYAAADALANKLKEKDKRYNTKVYKTWAAQDTNDLFRAPEMYGFFDPFSNTGDDEKNMYTKSYKAEILDMNTNTGEVVVVADLDKMNTDNCKFGVMDLLTAYDEKHPEVKDIEFTGSAKVYVNGTLISECKDKSTWLNIASLEAIPDGTWKIQGNLGNSVICSGDTEVKTVYTGGTLYTSVATRGWGGIYNDEYKMVTHEKSIQETLQALSLRSNATKIIIYSANQITDKVEFKPDTDVATDDKCQALGDYLNANKMHFMAVVPFILSDQMDAFYEKLTVNGATFGKWVPYGIGTPEFIGTDLYNYILSTATLVDNTQYRSCAFTAPGRYEIVYWGTNYGGKVTKPVTYQIEVEPDLAPIISGNIANKFLRDPLDSYKNKFRATIALTGPYSTRLKRDVLTITSPDGDYIDHTTVGVIWDANNNKIFTDSTDRKWDLSESTGTQLDDYLYYILTKLTAK